MKPIVFIQFVSMVPHMPKLQNREYIQFTYCYILIENDVINLKSEKKKFINCYNGIVVLRIKIYNGFIYGHRYNISLIRSKQRFHLILICCLFEYKTTINIVFAQVYCYFYTWVDVLLFTILYN